MTKNSVHHASYLRNNTWCDCHLWYTCKMIISADFCFIFFKILIFWVVRVIKRQKNCPKWQKILSVILHISGTIHHMIVIYGGGGKKWSKMTRNSVCCISYLRNHTSCDSFMVHICTITISSHASFIFPKIWFSGCIGCKRAINGPEWQEIVCFAPYLRNHTSYL